MRADFLDANERHQVDAEHLFQAQRWANADHLYGVSVECGLKRLMLSFGMSFDDVKDRPALREDREHAEGIWARFESYRSGYEQGVKYVLPSENPFSDWHVSQRYHHQSNFDKNRAEAHREGALLVREIIKQAQRNGLL